MNVNNKVKYSTKCVNLTLNMRQADFP